MVGKSDERPVGVERLTGGGLFEGLTERWAGRKGMDEEDAIYEAARELAEEGRILCFDEVCWVPLCVMKADQCAVSSDGYRDCDDSEAIIGADDGVWCCMRHHEQVGVVISHP